MRAEDFEELRKHVGHDIRCVTDDTSVEKDVLNFDCVNCGTGIISATKEDEADEKEPISVWQLSFRFENDVVDYLFLSHEDAFRELIEYVDSRWTYVARIVHPKPDDPNERIKVYFMNRPNSSYSLVETQVKCKE